MDTLTPEALAAAQREVTRSIAGCERMQGKFAPGTAQDTLLRNRLHALRVCAVLLAAAQDRAPDTAHAAASTSGTAAPSFTKEELTRAMPPILSLHRKAAKGQSGFAPGHATHTRFARILSAMGVCRLLLERALAKL